MLYAIAAAFLVVAIVLLAELADLGVPTNTALFADFARFTVYIAPPLAAVAVALIFSSVEEIK